MPILNGGQDIFSMNIASIIVSDIGRLIFCRIVYEVKFWIGASALFQIVGTKLFQRELLNITHIGFAMVFESS